MIGPPLDDATFRVNEPLAGFATVHEPVVREVIAYTVDVDGVTERVPGELA